MRSALLVCDRAALLKHLRGRFAINWHGAHVLAGDHIALEIDRQVVGAVHRALLSQSCGWPLKPNRIDEILNLDLGDAEAAGKTSADFPETLTTKLSVFGSALEGCGQSARQSRCGD